MRTAGTVAIVAAALLLSGCGGGGGGPGEPAAQETQTAAGGDGTQTAGPGEVPTGPVETLSLVATLSGDAAVPAGDPDGTGRAEIVLDRTLGEVCFAIEVANIAPATAAHIHQGAEGTAGGVVVGLDAPTDGSSEGCVDADAAAIDRIAAAPEGFYVNVHNEEYPQGAVRGQLAPEGA